MPQMQQLKDIKNLSHKTVIVRADFNVPLDKGMVTDATRINRGAATIQYLLQQKAKVVIISHLGRPDGQPNPAYSLQQVIPSLKKACMVMMCFLWTIVLARKWKKRLRD